MINIVEKLQERYKQERYKNAIKLMVYKQERYKQNLSILKNCETPISGWLQHDRASECLPGTNKPGYLSRSTSFQRGINITVFGYLPDN